MRNKRIVIDLTPEQAREITDKLLKPNKRGVYSHPRFSLLAEPLVRSRKLTVRLLNIREAKSFDKWTQESWNKPKKKIDKK